MNNTRIFVSSTCYDLAAVREDIRAMIIAMGHEPLLSEYPSFPISPDEKAIANCRRNVREHTDVLVLIVGGRRGSLDAETGKPITNLEYEEALTCGIPVYVFFNRPVLNLLYIWKKNPQADFTPTVDYPEVFTFIERIREGGVWTFSFERTEEIKDALRVQLSGLLKELLERRLGGRLEPLPEFANESKRAKQLAVEKPSYWEFHLSVELLSSRLAAVRQKHNDVAAGLVYKPLQSLKASEVLGWALLRLDEIQLLVKRFDPAFQQLVAAWGPPGQAGDAVQIKRGADKIGAFAEDVLNWEIEILSVRPPLPLAKLVNLLLNFRIGLLEKLESIPKTINDVFKDNPKPTGQLVINIVLEMPSTKELEAELEYLKNRPSLFLD